MNLVCLLFGVVAIARFFLVSNEDVNTFFEQQEKFNENNKMKKLYDLKIFKEFLESCHRVCLHTICSTHNEA